MVISLLFCRPFDDQSAGTTGVDPVNGSSSAHHQEGTPNGTGQKNAKDSAGKKREDPKPGPKKPKEKVDALSQFDLNNYASMSQVLFTYLSVCLFAVLSWMLYIKKISKKERVDLNDRS